MYCIQHLNGASVERCTIHRQYDIHGCTEEDWRACLCTMQPIISFSKRVLLCWLSNTDTSSYSVWRIFSPFTFILSKKKKNKLLESTYFNQSAPRVLLQIRASAITSPIIIFILFTRVPSEALRRNARWKLHRQSSDKRKSSPGPKSCFLLLFLHHVQETGFT